MTVDQIVQISQAGGLILLVAALLTGQVWARPSVEFIQAMLKGSLDREEKLADALSENTTIMRELVAELRVTKSAASR